MSDFMINPYSFIRIEENNPDRKKKEKGEYSGVIECSLSVKSPVFIPNTSATISYRNVPEHLHKVFYSYENLEGKGLSDLSSCSKPANPVIPGSELRGMVRNVYEQLTNSCFSQIDEFNLPYKRSPEPKIMCIMVWENDAWKIYPVLNPDCKTSNLKKLNLDSPSANFDYFSGVVGKDDDGVFFFDSDSWKNLLGDNNLSASIRNRFNQLYDASSYGRKNRINLNLEDFGFDFDENGKYYIHIPNYFIGKGTANKITVYSGTPSGVGFNVPEDALERLEMVLGIAENIKGGYTDKTINKNVDSAKLAASYAERYKKHCPLIVYADRNSVQKKFNSSQCVTYLSPSCMTKEFFGNKIEEILENNHKHNPCGNIESLCPACRLFGMVDKNDSTGAVKGKLRFTDTFECSNIGYMDEQTLPILSNPRIASTEFYLCPPIGWTKEQSGNYKGTWNYDYCTSYRKMDVGKRKITLFERDSANYKPRLAGRKVYLNSRYPEGGWHADVGKMNNSVTPLNKGDFKFNVYFDGLTSDELKTLRLSLELEDASGKTVHKIGTGKPIGMGQITVTVDKITRYSYASENGVIDKKYDDITADISTDGIEPGRREKVIEYSSEVGFPDPVEYPWDYDGSNQQQVYKWFSNNRGSVNEPKISQVLNPVGSSDIRLRHCKPATAPAGRAPAPGRTNSPARPAAPQGGKSEGTMCPHCGKFNFRYYKDSTNETDKWKKGICFSCGKSLFN